MSAVYPPIREQFIDWAINQSAPAGLVWCVILVNSTYVYSATHTTLSNVPGGSIEGTEKTLSGVVYPLGVLDADDQLWDDLTLNNDVDAAIIYLKDGLGNSYLVCYLDDSSDGSIPHNIDSTQGILKFNASGICKI